MTGASNDRHCWPSINCATCLSHPPLQAHCGQCSSSMAPSCRMPCPALQLAQCGHCSMSILWYVLIIVLYFLPSDTEELQCEVILLSVPCPISDQVAVCCIFDCAACPVPPVLLWEPVNSTMSDALDGQDWLAVSWWNAVAAVHTRNITFTCTWRWRFLLSSMGISTCFQRLLICSEFFFLFLTDDMVHFCSTLGNLILRIHPG